LTVERAWNRPQLRLIYSRDKGTRMFTNLQELFEKFTATSPEETPEAHQHTTRLAAAVLLVEVMQSDPAFNGPQREAVRSALGKRYALDEQELARLIGEAEAQSKKANDYFNFTSRLNDQCSQADKIALVEAMWSVAYANGALDANEIHVISKVAGLLNVTHGEYIAAKMHAKQAAGLP
jgi:uncharacterized tellurite resistance protein B-like protein